MRAVPHLDLTDCSRAFLDWAHGDVEDGFGSRTCFGDKPGNGSSTHNISIEGARKVLIGAHGDAKGDAISPRAVKLRT